MTAYPGVIGGAIAMAAIIGGTIAVCLGHIDGSAYSALVGAALGGGVGAGAHAAGAAQASR